MHYLNFQIVLVLVRALFLATVLVFSIFILSGFTVIDPDHPDMLGWDQSQLHINENLSECPGGADALGNLIGSAMGAWNAIRPDLILLQRGSFSLTSIQTAEAGRATDSPLIFCDSHIGKNTEVDPDTVPGISGVMVNLESKRVVYSYTALNSQPGANANIAGIDSRGIVVIIAHELGHVLGLGHSSDPNALMYFNVTGKLNPEPRTDDIDGLLHLYSPERQREVAGQNDNGGFGCGTLRHEQPTGTFSHNHLNQNKLSRATGFIQFLMMIILMTSLLRWPVCRPLLCNGSAKIQVEQ